MTASSQITDKTADIQTQFTYSTLGLMLYNNDDNTWVGQYNGYQYHIAFEKSAQPATDLLAYCVDFLSNKNWLDNMRPTEISRIKSTLAVSSHQEVDSLGYLSFMFYRAEGEPRLLIQLAPDGKDNDQDHNWWRMEFVGQKCHCFVADH
jgi:hypothetical protein